MRIKTVYFSGYFITAPNYLLLFKISTGKSSGSWSSSKPKRGSQKVAAQKALDRMSKRMYGLKECSDRTDQLRSPGKLIIQLCVLFPTNICHASVVIEC